MTFRRFAIYYTPRPGPLAHFGAAWLGRDLATGRPPPRPEVPGLTQDPRDLTTQPRRYGFHATLKPPFALAPGTSQAALQQACKALASTLPPVVIEALTLTRMGRFLALTATGDDGPLRDLAARVTRDLDPHRAAPEPAELARRRQARLSPRQEALLTRWGYPYVMEEFRFHLTLTGRLPRSEIDGVAGALQKALAPLLDRPVTIDDLTLVGEDHQGDFHSIARYALGPGPEHARPR